MACVVVSTAAAIGVGVAKQIVKHHEKKNNKNFEVSNNELPELKTSKKLGLLETTLFSGSFILAGEHILHGEIVPYFPFLTAASSPESTAEMLHEMATAGVGMTVALVAAWAIGLLVYRFIRKAKRAKTVEVK